MATLVQFWQQERDTHKAALAAAQGDLAAAQQALVAAKANLQADAAALDKLNSDIATNRAKLASSSVPSEVTALNAAIRDQLIERRRLQGAALDDQDALAWAQADVDSATSSVGRANSKLADAEARFKAATDADATARITTQSTSTSTAWASVSARASCRTRDHSSELNHRGVCGW